MKAKEYVAQYAEEFNSCDKQRCSAAANDIFGKFQDEAGELFKIRHVKTDGAAVAVLKELNTKWNVIANSFPRVLKRDVIKIFYTREVPGLARLWD